MLEEEGVVVALLEGRLARVRVRRNAACGRCASRNVCHAIGASSEMLVSARNPLQAKVGESVLLSLPEKTFLRASLLVYLLPVLALFGGAVIGQQFSQPAAILGAILGLSASFLGLWLYNKRLSPQAYSPTISRILGHPFSDK